MARPARRRATTGGPTPTNPMVQRLVDRWLSELQAAAAPRSGVLLDVGTATGRPIPGIEPSVGLLHRPGRPLDLGDRLSRPPSVVGDAAQLPFPDSCAELVTCIELLETLRSHRPVVRELARITSGTCIVSVPWEPWFRMGEVVRGRNLRRLGSDPAHEQSFTPKGLVRSLRRGFRDVELHPCFPWLVAECRGPRT